MVDDTALRQPGTSDESLWHQVADASPDPMSIMGDDGHYVAVNSAFALLAGRARRDFPGHTAHDMWPAEVALRFADLDLEARRAGGQSTILERFESLDPPTDLLMTSGVLPGSEGRLTFSISRNLATMRELGAAVHDREAVFRNLFDRVGDGVFVVDMNSMEFVEFNTVAHEMHGYTRPEFQNLSVADLQFEDRPEWVQAKMVETLTAGSARFENRHRHKDGTPRDVIVDNSLVEVAGRQLLVTVVHDVTELKDRATMLARAEQLALLGSWRLVIDDGRLTWSEEVYRIFEVEPATFDRNFESFLSLVHAEDRSGLVSAYEESLRTRQPYEFEHRAVMADGRVKVVLERGSTDYDVDGHPIRSFGTCQDVTERHEARRQLERLAFEDQLTGLPNRTAAKKHLDRLLVGPDPVVVLQVDLESIQQINGIYGHLFGDEVLISTGARIAEMLDTGDYLARVGGDEFMIIRSGAEAAEALDLAHAVRATIQSQVTGPYGVPVRLDARVGIAAGGGADGEAGAILLQQADTALHLAREGQACQVYAAEMAADMRHRLLVLSRFGVALENDELFLEFQPQCTAAGDLVGAEALVRWRTIQGEIIPPKEFIPVVENTSLMERLGAWVLDRAAAQVALWEAEGLAVPPLSVNVSARQFLGPKTVSDQVTSVLKRHRLDPSALELEITESVMMPNAGQVPADVKRLTELGIPLVVDDFGTGYSSMSVLYQLPLSKIKIDRSLICGLPDSRGAGAVVAATLALARALGVDCLAEGVETEQERDWLVDAGCTMFQGFIFAGPRPAEQFAARWLRPVDSGRS